MALLSLVALLILSVVVVVANRLQNTTLSSAEKQRREVEVQRLIDGLLAADTVEAPKFIEELRAYQDSARPLLRAIFERSAADSNEKLHSALALLSDESESTFAAFVGQRLLEVEPRQFAPVRTALLPFADSLKDTYWMVISDSDSTDETKFRAAAALAQLDPSSARWNDNTLAQMIAARLTSVSSPFVPYWRDALRPKRDALFAPLLITYESSATTSQQRASSLATLRSYFATNPIRLCEVMFASGHEGFRTLLPELTSHPSVVESSAKSQLEADWRSIPDEDLKDRVARRVANAALALYALGQYHELWPLLRHSNDPRVRSNIVHALAALDYDPLPLLNRYPQESEPSSRRALLLALGKFAPERISPGVKGPFLRSLLADFESNADVGIHSAARWLLRQWGRSNEVHEVEDRLRQAGRFRGAARNEGRNWYVNSERQTFAILDADRFLMGSPTKEAGRSPESGELVSHQRQIGRRIAISTTEVTTAQFLRFNRDFDHNGMSAVKTDDSPIVGVTWFEAVAYCNWLSEREGIPKDQWCYEPNDDGKYQPGMKVKPRFWELVGYRLPTQAEWEYATRAGAVTSRFYGASPELLSHYACRDPTRTRVFSVGTKMPNDFGLFDVYGNVAEWCCTGAERQVAHDQPRIGSVSLERHRSYRGGGVTFQDEHFRSAATSATNPGLRYVTIGFRVVRTYDMGPFLERMYQARLRQFGRGSPVTAAAAHKYLSVLRQSNRMAEAEQLEATISSVCSANGDLKFEAAQPQEHGEIFNYIYADGYRPVAIKIIEGGSKVRCHYRLQSEMPVAGFDLRTKLTRAEFIRKSQEQKQKGRKLVSKELYQFQGTTYTAALWIDYEPLSRADEWEEQGALSRAETCLRRHVELRRLQFGNNSPMVATATWKLIDLLRRTKRGKEASELLAALPKEFASKSRLKVECEFGDEHRQVFSFLSDDGYLPLTFKIADDVRRLTCVYCSRTETSVITSLLRSRAYTRTV